MIQGLYSIFDHWHNAPGKSVWVISDTHFADSDIKAGYLNRPSDDDLVKMINSKVGRRDTLIHLGDVGDIEYAKKLRGYKVLVAGNHEAGCTNYLRKVETKIFDSDIYTKEQALQKMKEEFPNCKYTISQEYDVSHSPFVYWKVEADNQLFDEVYPGALMIGEKLLLSHEPVDVKWAYNLHGHDHAGAKRENHYNVCADVIEYIPMNFNTFMKSGFAAKVETIHRQTIDKATKRKKARGGKKIGRG